MSGRLPIVCLGAERCLPGAATLLVDFLTSLLLALSYVSSREASTVLRFYDHVKVLPVCSHSSVENTHTEGMGA